MTDDALPTEERLTGIVVSQQANFFYVKAGAEEYACSLRGRLKKEGETPYVGDHVEIVLEPPAPGEKLPSHRELAAAFEADVLYAGDRR